MSARPSFPATVVLPVPLTPTMSMMEGRSPCEPVCRVRSMSGPIWRMSSCAASCAPASGSRVPVTFTWVRSSSVIWRDGATPMSAVIRVSSMSSQAWSSRASRESRLSRVEPNPPREAASLPRSRVRRPRSGAGAASRSVGSRPAGPAARGSVAPRRAAFPFWPEELRSRPVSGPGYGRPGRRANPAAAREDQERGPQPGDHQDGDGDENDHKFHNGPSLADAPACVGPATAAGHGALRPVAARP